MNTGLRVTAFRDFKPCSLVDVSEDPAFIFFLEDGKIRALRINGTHLSNNTA
jgi:hypothetical protein